MSKKFNFEDYKGNYVMCCKTIEEAMDFCRVMHEAGKTWDSGESYLKTSNWGLYEGGVCYNFNDGLWGTINTYTGKSKILYWSDFMDKEFTKDDLKNGDVVLRRDGDVGIHIEGLFVDKDGLDFGSIFLNRDLSHTDAYDRDIMAVIRPVTIEDMSFDAFEKKLGRLVYEREETVEMTIEEVCKALGKNVKIVKG